MDKTIIQKMKNEYFEYKGQRYYAGTKFTMKKGTGYDRDTIVIATFRGYANNNPEDLYICYNIKKLQRITETSVCIIVNRNKINDYIIDIVSGNYYMELESRKKYCKDSDIPELIIGWPLYIFLMILATIFHKTIGAWIMLTVIFFTWRHNLKTKEYYYYE